MTVLRLTIARSEMPTYSSSGSRLEEGGRLLLSFFTSVVRLYSFSPLLCRRFFPSPTPGWPLRNSDLFFRRGALRGFQNMNSLEKVASRSVMNSSSTSFFFSSSSCSFFLFFSFFSSSSLSSSPQGFSSFFHLFLSSFLLSLCFLLTILPPLSIFFPFLHPPPFLCSFFFLLSFLSLSFPFPLCFFLFLVSSCLFLLFYLSFLFFFPLPLPTLWFLLPPPPPPLLQYSARRPQSSTRPSGRRSDPTCPRSLAP